MASGKPGAVHAAVPRVFKQNRGNGGQGVWKIELLPTGAGAANKVVGFGHQFIKVLIPPPAEGPDSPAAQPGPRIMQGADAVPFQALRTKIEAEWVPQMMEVLGIDAA